LSAIFLVLKNVSLTLGHKVLQDLKETLAQTACKASKALLDLKVFKE
jgi:hypothetical protein